MLIGQVYIKDTSLILRDVGGSEVSLPIQDTMELHQWMLDHQSELEACMRKVEEGEAQRAIKQYTELSRRIQVGAYEERSAYHHENGAWPEDGVEESGHNLEAWAAQRGLEFTWNEGTKAFTLEPMSQERLEAFQESEDSRKYMEHYYLGGD